MMTRRHAFEKMVVCPRFLLLAIGALGLAACSAARVAYDNADTLLRFMAASYLDLDAAQSDDLTPRIARFHQWHRANELPVYAALLRSASERAAVGINAEDFAWGLANVRLRYRRFAAKAAEDAAPVLATLAPPQLAALEHKFAESNEKYAKEFLSSDDRERRRRQLKRMLERFRDFAGELTPAQEARIGRFALATERQVALRVADRQPRRPAAGRSSVCSSAFATVPASPLRTRRPASGASRSPTSAMSPCASRTGSAGSAISSRRSGGTACPRSSAGTSPRCSRGRSCAAPRNSSGRTRVGRRIWDGSSWISTARSPRSSAHTWSGAFRITPKISPYSPEEGRRPREPAARDAASSFPGDARVVRLELGGIGRRGRAEALERRRDAATCTARSPGQGAQARRLSGQGRGAQFLGDLVRSLPRGDAFDAAAAGQARGKILRDPRDRLRRRRAADPGLPEESPGALHGAAGSGHRRRDGVESEGAAHHPGARSPATNQILRGGRSGLGFSIR